jgi:hypothetical protein
VAGIGGIEFAQNGAYDSHVGRTKSFKIKGQMVD